MLRLGAAMALLMVALMPVSAQNPASPLQPSAPKPADLCTLEGVVVKSTTGEGIRKIDVTASPVGETQSSPGTLPQQAVTDSSGRFIIVGLPPGRYVLNAFGNGYPWEAYKLSPGPNATVLTLAPGSHQKDVLFRLTPPGVITGTVYDEDGYPAVNAWVRAVRVSSAGRRHRTLSSGGAQTNDLGQYRVFGLEPGQYILSAGRQEISGLNQPADEVYLPTFYPGTPDPAEAATVRLEPDAESPGIDISLQKVHAVSVRGRVSGFNRIALLRGTWVQLMPRAGGDGMRMDIHGGPIESDQGDFEIRGVPPGAYSLFLRWGDGKQSLFGQTAVDVGGADVDGVALTLGTGVELAGRFEIEPGGTLIPTQLNLWLNPANPGMGGGGNAQVRPDGTFVIPDLMDGDYRLHIGGFPEEYYVKWARLGGLDVLGPGITIRQSQSPGPLEIGLARDGGRIEGVVMKDQKPFPGAQVVLAPDPPNRGRDDWYDVKTTDPLGRFSMLGLPPGDFKLFAWEPREGLPFNDPDFIQEYEKQGAPVHIEAQSQQSVQLELIAVDESPDQ